MHCLLHGRLGRCVRCVGPGTCDGSDCHRTEFLGTTQTTEQIQTQSKQSQLGWLPCVTILTSMESIGWIIGQFLMLLAMLVLLDSILQMQLFQISDK